MLDGCSSQQGNACLQAQNASNDEWMAQITGSLGPEMRARFLQQVSRSL